MGREGAGRRGILRRVLVGTLQAAASLLGIAGLLLCVQDRVCACSRESPESALASNLATLRQAVELYRGQHGNLLPGSDLPAALLGTSDTSREPNPQGPCGPYLRSFPPCPISHRDDIRVVGWLPEGADGSSGWIWCPWTGDLRSNAPGVGPSGTAYFDL